MSKSDSARLSEADVQHIATLARLKLSPEEVTLMTSELTAIMAYVAQLEQLDTTDVPPTTQLHVERMPLRADELAPSLPREVALREAPRLAHEGFAVPGFVDE